MTDNLSHLPVNPLPHVPRHTYGVPRYVHADPARGRLYNQTERVCVCGVIKVTVHGSDGYAWREWRMTETGDQFSDALGAPECSVEQAP